MTLIHSSDDQFYIAPQKVYVGVSLGAHSKDSSSLYLFSSFSLLLFPGHQPTSLVCSSNKLNTCKPYSRLGFRVPG